MVAFYREDSVAINVDNQQFLGGVTVYPHSFVEIETMGSSSETHPSLEKWIDLIEQLTANLALEFSLVGPNSSFADFLRTPLGIGIGLPENFWILCLGPDYGELVKGPSANTSFFMRKNRETLQTFITAVSFEAHLVRPIELTDAQKNEIGADLFHRLPLRPKSGAGEVSWIFSPANVVRFLSMLWRENTTNWYKYQARLVPAYYRRK